MKKCIVYVKSKSLDFPEYLSSGLPTRLDTNYRDSFGVMVLKMKEFLLQQTLFDRSGIRWEIVGCTLYSEEKSVVETTELQNHYEFCMFQIRFDHLPFR